MLKKQRHINKLFFLGSIAILPACYRKMGKSLISHQYDEQHILDAQAYLSDIPLPIQAKVYSLNGSTSTTTGLTFIHSFSVKDIVAFYEFEMERLGWNQLKLFSVSSEILLIFEKPQKMCTVSIRPDKRVVIFFGTKV